LVPRPSRVYDYLAGGYHNDEADGQLAGKLEQIYPGIRRLVTNNRAYLAHAVLLAGSHLGIRQFLELGSGFPGPGSVREAAQAADPLRRSRARTWTGQWRGTGPGWPGRA
jgi:hypothetical protein